MKYAVSFVLIAGFACSLAAAPPVDPGAGFEEAKVADDRWNDADVGPFLASVLKLPQGPVAKGLSVKVNAEGTAAVAYDLKSCAMRCGWQGEFLAFNPARFGITTAPRVAGEFQFQNKAAGSLSRAHYEGLTRHGRRVVLRWRVDDVLIQESPWSRKNKSTTVWTRTFLAPPHKQPLVLSLLTGAAPVAVEESALIATASVAANKKNTPWIVALQCGENAAQLQAVGPQLQVLLAPASTAQTVQVAFAAAGDNAPATRAQLSATPLEDVAVLAKPGGRLWPEEIPSPGVLGQTDGSYAIDTLPPPFENPYKSLLFISGHDFFADGSMAVSTLHGDVWLVRGVDRDLKNVVWKRFASGLHQPLGLRILDDAAYVLGKDQITRLRDLNGDGEADDYANFNNDGATSLGGHDFASCLETDPSGAFYYIRAHEGVVRVSPDGKEHRSIATGFRNPIGLGVGPQGQVTAAPQEGTWTPASCIIEVREGGYYGFAGPKQTETRPLGYDRPLCYMPRVRDNSSGGQVWIDNPHWGLPQGSMLHLSFGQCKVMLVLREEVNGQMQGGTVDLPLFFESGVMRGRFSPHDHQLYVSGLRGWQTAAAKDGCLQRVRYTGKPPHTPTHLRVLSDGVELTFASPVDPESAGDPDNYFIEEWNYLYSKNYGSKEYRPSAPKKFGRDERFLDDAIVSKDGRKVRLIFEDPPTPVMQMAITCSLQSPQGDDLRYTIYNTINETPPSK